MKVLNLRVGSLDLNYMELSWELDAHRVEALTATMEVLRAGSPEGPFEVIGGPLVDTYRFRDYVAPLRGTFQYLYYKVRVSGVGGEHESDVATSDPRPPLDALEIIRVENLLFREFTGRPCALYSARTFGVRCATCFDSVTQRRTLSSCTACYNTGFMRGFHNPVMVYAQIDPFAKTQQNTQQHVLEQASTQARLGVYPKLKPRDVLIERENVRWRVMAVTTTERLRAPVHQELTLFKIPLGDIEYKIPLVWPNAETSPRSYATKSDL